MCGIVGIASTHSVARDVYDTLTVLQHRGQDAAGIATWDGNRIYLRKGMGLVRDVFRQHHMDRLRGSVGIGHVRYPTDGGMQVAEAQPMYVSVPCGICLAHNGNLINTAELAGQLQRECLRDISTGSDSEVLLNLLAHHLKEHLQSNASASTAQAAFAAVDDFMSQSHGAYSVVALIKGIGLLAFRDPMGIRPLCLGQRTESDGSVSYMVASESAALQSLDFDLQRDIAPGEAVLIAANEAGVFEPISRAPISAMGHRPCIFEWVYLARPDSILDGASVYEARRNMGSALSARIAREMPDLIEQTDVIIPVPECSTTCAAQMATDLRIPYREAFVKNRYIGRTFIMPVQSQRRRSVRQKLNPLEAEFRGKNVLLVDDSIVRGTTSAELVALARRMQARKVFFASAAPPIRYANVFGIDMPTTSELVASGMEIEEVRKAIQADRLIYQTLDDLEGSVRRAAPHLKDFEVSIFTGKYPLAAVSEQYLNHLATRRSEEEKQRLFSDSGLEPAEVSGIF